MDPAHDWTDGQIDDLTKKFKGVYSRAAHEMREKLDGYLATYEEQNASWQRMLASGEAKQPEYEAWLEQVTMDRQLMEGLASSLATDATRANQKALDMVNDRIPRVYAENANYGAYQVEKGLGWDTHSFDLYDESTVRRLLTATDQDQIIHEVIPVGPPRPKWQDLRVDLDRAKDVRWNRQKFTSAITQSILQGESVPNAAKRLMRVLNMDRGMATRAARTAMTSAENAGRVDSYKRAKAHGIDLEQEWMATLDGRTRYSHRQLDGQHVPVGEKFEVEGHEIEFPGDPKAHPSETYNCRCTLVAWFPGIEKEDPERWSRLPKGMSYDEWKEGKKVEKERKDAAGVVDGKDILGTWKRRPDKFDFEIEDVLNAQGFDGKPRVVSAEEFDAAVKAANNGNGFIAQRTYTAPDQETLDSYREMLYDGKFYVDCSTGGAQYGQGMYCAADYTGTLTDGIKEEMEHYSQLGMQRYNNMGRMLASANGMTIEEYRASYGFAPSSYTETLTLDPSAKIIRYADIDAEFARAEADSFLGVVKKANPRLTDREAAAVVREYGGTTSGSTFNLAKSWEREDPDGYDAFIEAQGKAGDEYKDAIEEVRLATASLDDGSKAAAMGYDAINAEGHGASGSYTVILNRTKLIIRRP